MPSSSMACRTKSITSLTVLSVRSSSLSTLWPGSGVAGCNVWKLVNEYCRKTFCGTGSGIAVVPEQVLYRADYYTSSDTDTRSDMAEPLPSDDPDPTMTAEQSDDAMTKVRHIARQIAGTADAYLNRRNWPPSVMD